MIITVVYSLPTQRVRKNGYLLAESDTEMSAGLIRDALVRLGHTVDTLPIGEDSIHVLENVQSDVLFNVIEWTGLDLPYALKAMTAIEKSGIPFTGASRMNYWNTTDKVRMKRLFDKNHLPTARWQEFQNGNESLRSDFQLPVIIKVAWEHSGVGLEPDSYVENYNQIVDRIRSRIQKHQQPILVEEFIDGSDIEVGMVEVAGECHVFPPVLNEYNKDSPVKFLTYNGRWPADYKSHVQYTVMVPNFSPEISKAIIDICRKTYTLLKFRDYARFDIRINSGGLPILIETNSNPGIDDHPENGLAVGFHAAGYAFDTFIQAIINSTLRRWGKKEVDYSINREL